MHTETDIYTSDVCMGHVVDSLLKCLHTPFCSESPWSLEVLVALGVGYQQETLLPQSLGPGVAAATSPRLKKAVTVF